MPWPIKPEAPMNPMVCMLGSPPWDWSWFILRRGFAPGQVTPSSEAVDAVAAPGLIVGRERGKGAARVRERIRVGGCVASIARDQSERLPREQVLQWRRVVRASQFEASFRILTRLDEFASLAPRLGKPIFGALDFQPA